VATALPGPRPPSRPTFLEMNGNPPPCQGRQLGPRFSNGAIGTPPRIMTLSVPAGDHRDEERHDQPNDQAERSGGEASAPASP